MKYLLLLLLCLGCQNDNTYIEYAEGEHIQSATLIKEYLFYIKDPATHLCFAVIHPYWNNSSFTSVPCTEEVEKKLVNK